MAIEGPLRELSLPDVLQLVHLSRKTGTLSVRNDGYPRPALLYFEEGAIVGARAPGEWSDIGRLLMLAGRLTMAQLDEAIAAQRRSPGRRLGELLVETQGVAAADVIKQLEFQVQETMFELVRWTEGHFRFEEAPPFDPGRLRIRMATESLLLESLRRLDEWSELASGAPDTAVVPRLVESAGSVGDVLQLAPTEWEVLAAVDGERTLRAIARELGRAEFEVAKAIFSLASSGVVELGKRPRDGSAPATRTGGLAAEVREIEQELEAGRHEAAERRVAELAGRYPERAEVELLRGRLAGARGEWGAAVASLKSAVGRDPLLASAYFHLGAAWLRTGELDRAGDALATCARLAGPDAKRGAVAARAAALLTQLRSLLEGSQ
jgi:hypothetical protein